MYAIRSSTAALLIALAVALAALPAAASEAIAGAGVLEDASHFGRTITIRGVDYDVTGNTDLRDENNRPIGLGEIEKRLGEWVYYKGFHKRPRPVLDVLQIAPEDAYE